MKRRHARVTLGTMKGIVLIAALGCQATPTTDPAPPHAPKSMPVDAMLAVDATAPISDARVIACAEVDIGLDLRALPVQRTPGRPPQPSGGSIDMFVGGQVDEFLAKALPGSPPRIFTRSEVGGILARFDGPDAMERCRKTTAAYLATAPRLPQIMAPAAQVTTPCGPCT